MAEVTPRLGLKKPSIGEEGWGSPLRETIDVLDAAAETVEGAQAKVAVHALTAHGMSEAAHDAHDHTGIQGVGEVDLSNYEGDHVRLTSNAVGGTELTALGGGDLFVSTMGGVSSGSIDISSDQNLVISANAVVSISSYGGPIDLLHDVDIAGSVTMTRQTASLSALRTQLAGDAFPRFQMMADTENGWYFGDGTADPYNTGFNLYTRFQNDPPTFIFTKGGAGPNPLWEFTGDVGIESVGGFILNAPNGTAYRIKVANDGTLSTEVVV